LTKKARDIVPLRLRKVLPIGYAQRNRLREVGDDFFFGIHQAVVRPALPRSKKKSKRLDGFEKKVATTEFAVAVSRFGFAVGAELLASEFWKCWYWPSAQFCGSAAELCSSGQRMEWQ
jgi:hypothetical protein